MSQHVDFKSLIIGTYKHAAWGSDRPENARELERLHELTLQQGNPSLLAKVETARRNGEQAYGLVQQLLRKLEEQGDTPVVQAWLERQKVRAAHHQIATTLTIEYDKWHQHQQRRASRRASPTYCSRLQPPDLSAGYHPSNLRYLPPSRHWQILIDETGSEFASEQATLTEQDRRLGKVVGLALPAEARLPSLAPGFHATEAPPEEVDACVQALLEAPVGIFGFSVRDSASRHHYWLGHVTQLVRWMLLMLPIQAEEATRVEVWVEQRSGLTPDSDLEPLAQLVEGELKAFDPRRFGQLLLSMRVMDKAGHPANGYVDAVACTWGGSLAVHEDRLKRSRLLGHCLLQPRNERALERLYLAAVEARRLPADDWLALCEAVAEAPDAGVLGVALAQYGERIQRTPTRWQALLQEVRHHQALKSLDHYGLVAALDWLARHAPAGRSLGPRLTLELESARLSLANHQGQVETARLQTLLGLCNALEAEDSPAVCQALLRVAVSTTNTFEFAAMQPIVESWLEKPVAQPGLLNHAKLHSTLGQLQAFQGHPEAAQVSFERALEHLARLSDPEQAQRESRQTDTYRLMALGEVPGRRGEARSAIWARLREVTGQASDSQVVRFLARADSTWRFEHHLMLRTLVAWPEQAEEAVTEYLEQADQWRTGAMHPWGMVLAYRGWLYALRGNDDEARHWLDEAAACCRQPQQGITLQWMGDVVQALGISLGVWPTQPASPDWPSRLPHAPHEALAGLQALPSTVDHATRWSTFCCCLPYLFH